MFYREELKKFYESFIEDKKCEMLKERTISDYRDHFRYLTSYLDTTGKTEMVTARDLKGYGLWMKEEKGYSVHTINIRLSSLKCFLKWLYDEGYIAKKFYSSIKKAKEDKLKIRGLSIAEQKKFIKVVRVSQGDSPVIKRAKYFLMLTYYTGMRPQEAVDLKIEDIDFKGEYIRVEGATSKTGQSRLIATWDHNLEMLLEDIIAFNRSYKHPTPYLFFNLIDGRKLNYGTVRHNILKLKKEWRLEKTHSYAMRHTFAGNTQTIGLGNLKQAMGHKSSRSTERYLNSSPDMVRESFNNSRNKIIRCDYNEPVTCGEVTSIFGCEVREIDGYTVIMPNKGPSQKLYWK